MLILAQFVMTFLLSLFQKDYKTENRIHKSNPKETPTFNRLNEIREQLKREKKLWELEVPNGVNYRMSTEKKKTPGLVYIRRSLVTLEDGFQRLRNQCSNTALKGLLPLACYLEACHLHTKNSNKRVWCFWATGVTRCAWIIKKRKEPLPWMISWCLFHNHGTPSRNMLGFV